MTEGSIGDKMFFFAMPLAATGILQQLFNAADVAVVGQFCSSDAMAAVGSNSSIIGLLVNLFVGISLGANVVIARHTGAGHEEKVRESVHTAILVAILGGFIMLLFGQAIARPLLNLMGVPEDILPMAEAYLRIYLIGMPVILLYNFESAIFRSQGDTRTPLLCLIISGVINVVLNLFFVIVLGMDADGVATATVIANAVSSILMFVMLTRRKDAIRVEFKRLRIHKSALGAMLRIGVPAGIQGMVFSLSNVCIQSAINSLGATVMAASAAGFNMEVFAYYIINSFGQATTTFTSQNLGAGKPQRCKKVLLRGVMLGEAGAIIMTLALLLPGEQILSLFNSDPEVIAYGMIRLRYILIPYVVNTLIEIFSGSLRGFGHSLAPAIMTLIGVCGVRIIWVIFYFPTHKDFGSLLMAYPISWIVTSAAIMLVYFIMRPGLYKEA